MILLRCTRLLVLVGQRTLKMVVCVSSPPMSPNIEGALEPPRLAWMILHWLSRVAGRARTPHHERECRVDQHATVLIPRLYHSDRLNNAIKSPKHGQLHHMEVEERRFADTARPISLQVDDNSQDNGSYALFAERHQQTTDLEDNIE